MKRYHNLTTMNKDYTKLLLLLVAPFLLLIGCEEDEQLPNDAPRIAFSVAEADLQGIETVNGEGGPAIKGTVQSDAGLRELTIELLKSSGNEVVEQLTDLSAVDSKLYIINFTPAYTPEITGVRVVAVDVQNRTVEKTMAISVEKEVPTLTFSPADGPVGTQVTAKLTLVTLTESNIISLTLGDMEIAEYTLLEDGKSLQFVIPEGAQTANLTLTLADEEPIVSATEFKVTEKPKEIVTYSNIEVNAQGNRNDEGVKTNFSAEGATFTLADGMDEAVSSQIDIIVADSGGSNELDLFSPSHTGWLENNYFKDMLWPVRNETKLLLLADKDQTYFNNITAEELNALSVGTDHKLRYDIPNGGVGAVVLFETADGKKGLIYGKAHTDPVSTGSKTDVFTLDLKVLE